MRERSLESGKGGTWGGFCGERSEWKVILCHEYMFRVQEGTSFWSLLWSGKSFSRQKGVWSRELKIMSP